MNVGEKEADLWQRGGKLTYQLLRRGDSTRALRDTTLGSVLRRAQRQPEDRRVELGGHRASKHLKGRELVCILFLNARPHEVDHLAGLGGRCVGHVRAVRIEHHHELARDEAR